MVKSLTLLVLLMLLPFSAMGQEKTRELKINDAGFGFLLSSHGQSFFYYRGTSPFKINQAFLRTGIHFEEPSIVVPYINPYTGRQESNSNQQYYIESTIGARRLLFMDKIAGGLFPYVATEIGAGAYVAQVGTYRNAFKQFALDWAPVMQIGFGAGMHVGDALYRVEGGYFSSLDDLALASYPGYSGVFLKFIMTNGLKPR